MSRLGVLVKRCGRYLKLSTPKLVNGFKECGGVPFQEAPTIVLWLLKLFLVL